MGLGNGTSQGTQDTTSALDTYLKLLASANAQPAAAQSSPGMRVGSLQGIQLPPAIQPQPLPNYPIQGVPLHSYGQQPNWQDILKSLFANRAPSADQGTANG